jgi:hypothetical protein
MQRAPPARHGSARVLHAALKQQNLGRRIRKSQEGLAQRNKLQSGGKGPKSLFPAEDRIVSGRSSGSHLKIPF